MPFQPCPGTASVELRALLNGQHVENVFHVRVGNTPTLDDLTAVGTVFNDWATGPYAARLSTNLSWNEIIVTDLNVSGGIQYVKDMSGEGGGEVDSAVKTNQDTIAIKLLTGHAGRSFRGRMYWLAIPTSQYLDPNHLGSTSLAACVSAVNTLREDLNTAGFPLGVLSRFSGVTTDHKPIPRTNGLLTDVVSIAATDDIVDSQNRRLPGRGA